MIDGICVRWVQNVDNKLLNHEISMSEQIHQFHHPVVTTLYEWRKDILCWNKCRNRFKDQHWLSTCSHSIYNPKVRTYHWKNEHLLSVPLWSCKNLFLWTRSMDFVLFSDHLLHDKEEDGLFIFIIVSFCIVLPTYTKTMRLRIFRVAN